MPGSVLDLNGAYDDTWRAADEPMFLEQGHEYGANGRAGSSRMSGGTPRLQDSRMGTPRALEWDQDGGAAFSPLKITDRPSLEDGYEQSLLGPLERQDSPLDRRRGAAQANPGPFSGGPTDTGRRSNVVDPTYSFPRNPKTPYEVLGISELATQDEIKRAYKAGALHNHPDLCRGTEQDKEAATRRFQMIAEAFAILGDPKRRAEYDINRRDRARKTHGVFGSSSTTPARPPTFKSNFMPEQPLPSAWESPSGASNTSYAAPKVDLTDLDPFYLFKRMYGDPSTLFDNMSSNPSRHSPHRAGRRHEAGESSSFPSFADLGNLLSDPLQQQHAAGFGSRLRGPGNSFKVEENHSRAHLNRHGQLNVTQSQKTFKVHKSGGFTFESKSVSGSLGSGNMDMMAAIFGNGFGQGQQPGVLGGGMSSPFAALGGMMGGPPPSYRPRRQSLSGLGDDSFSALTAPSPGGRILQRSPSMSFNGHSPLHRDTPLQLGPPASSPRDLDLYGTGSRDLVDFNSWDHNGW